MMDRTYGCDGCSSSRSGVEGGGRLGRHAQFIVPVNSAYPRYLYNSGLDAVGHTYSSGGAN